MEDVPAAATRCPHCAGDIAQHELLNSKVCFVATAAMGRDDHPDVEVLRAFRDAVLLPKPWGRWFIRCYYKIGPMLACAIRRSSFLRGVACRFVVRPLARAARRETPGA